MELCGCLANELCHMLTECRNLYCVMRFFLSSDRVVETIVTSHVYRIQKTWLCHKANLSLHRVVETIVPSHVYRIPKTLLCHKANLSLHRGVKTIVTSITLSNQTFLNFPSVVIDVLHATSIPPPRPPYFHPPLSLSHIHSSTIAIQRLIYTHVYSHHKRPPANIYNIYTKCQCTVEPSSWVCPKNQAKRSLKRGLVLGSLTMEVSNEWVW